MRLGPRLAPRWAVIGVVALFVEAALRLGVRGAATLPTLSPGEWLIAAPVIAAFAYGEGVRALHRRFTPAVLARAAALGDAPPSAWPLAPLHALGLLGGTAATRRHACLAAAAIVAAIAVVASLPEPWRGVVDAGVAAAMAIGAASLVGRARVGAARPGRSAGPWAAPAVTGTARASRRPS